MFAKYNKENHQGFILREREFPKASPYGWKNYPFDYYNIWVKNAGPKPYLEEPTLEMLTKDYDVIIFKHCFPVTNIQESSGISNLDSEVKTIENYKLQYTALKSKLHQFPSTKFIIFTGAAQVESNISESEALKAQEFFHWVIKEWDMMNDNIYIWDLYNLETKGTLYLLDDYALSPNDSHPNKEFAAIAAELLFNRIIDIIKTDGQFTKLTGE